VGCARRPAHRPHADRARLRLAARASRRSARRRVG
jgi:hypothetical protein